MQTQAKITTQTSMPATLPAKLIVERANAKIDVPSEGV
jgi:hypothetical protein